MGRGDEARLRRDVEAIGGAAERMGRLIEDLLELSRIGRLVNPPQQVALAELVREAVELLAGQIAEAGVEVEIAPDLPAVFGDRMRLSEVLQNLLDNAVRYMGDQESPRIEIGARSEGAESVFFVRDNGIGIDPRYHDKVFGLFERLDSASEGSGIGLALARRIIEVHGGRIWVESEGEARGSTFCFTLPCDRAPPAPTRRGEGTV
jgi:signal transduction histidine kinase